MSGRYDDPDEAKTQMDSPGRGGGQRGSWGLGIAPPSDDEAPTTADTIIDTTHGHFPDDADEQATRIFQVPASTGGGPVQLSAAPVGWLAIVDGPGFGTAFPLAYGSNRVGRGTNVEVALNFGDESISRGTHCRITYDPKGRIFYLQSGEGSGLTYRDGAPVLTPTQLEAGARIEIGHTMLHFVPLCGPVFEWQDQPAAKAITR